MSIATFCVLAGIAVGSAKTDAVVVLFADRVVSVERTLEDPTDLWVTADDLTKINGFAIKPEGVCWDQICIPTAGANDGELLVNRDGDQWINLTALARKLGQSYVVDRDARVWSFSAIPAARSSFLESGLAPDFELPNRAGKNVSLSQFRGKKVLIVTWASW